MCRAWCFLHLSLHGSTPSTPLERMHCSISIPSHQCLLGCLPVSGRVESSGCPGSCLAHEEELPAWCWAPGPFPGHSLRVASGCPGLQGCPYSVGSSALEGAVGMCRVASRWAVLCECHSLAVRELGCFRKGPPGALHGGPSDPGQASAILQGPWQPPRAFTCFSPSF